MVLALLALIAFIVSLPLLDRRCDLIIDKRLESIPQKNRELVREFIAENKHENISGAYGRWVYKVLNGGPYDIEFDVINESRYRLQCLSDNPYRGSLCRTTVFFKITDGKLVVMERYAELWNISK